MKGFQLDAKSIRRIGDEATRILEKQNRLQMSQVFPLRYIDEPMGLAFQEFYGEAASPNRRCSQRGLEIFRSRRSEEGPR